MHYMACCIARATVKPCSKLLCRAMHAAWLRKVQHLYKNVYPQARGQKSLFCRDNIPRATLPIAHLRGCLPLRLQRLVCMQST